MALEAKALGGDENEVPAALVAVTATLRKPKIWPFESFALLPETLASVPFGFVLVRVRVPLMRPWRLYSIGKYENHVCDHSSCQSTK